MEYKAYTLHNFRTIPQTGVLSEEQLFDIEVVGRVLPFKTNSFVVEHLINWDKVPNDPMFVLTFPQRDMLAPSHYQEIAGLLRQGADNKTIRPVAERIRRSLNPHPAGQGDLNRPALNDETLSGMQHKYAQTVLFFPSQGQTCHAYCTFCFRWPQFTGTPEWKFASRQSAGLLAYLHQHPEVSDVLFTGGDPLIMSVKNLAAYIEPLLSADLPQLRRIRIGTKALSYWPYKFTRGEEAGELLALFRKVVRSGRHLALMAHINHPVELESPAVREAIARVRQTGAEVRCQSPLLKYINDDPALWQRMWNAQVNLGCIPYYMFMSRDTGAQDYFAVPLVRAWRIFCEAYQNVSGLCRTVRGPSMSANPGKVQVMGVAEIAGEKVIELRLIQARNPAWTQSPFFARYDENAIWLDDLQPAFGDEEFFYERELRRMSCARRTDLRLGGQEPFLQKASNRLV